MAEEKKQKNPLPDRFVTVQAPTAYSGTIKKALSFVSIAKRFPHGGYWSGKQGQDPGARLRQMISEKEISKASDDVMEAEREKISREHPHGVDWARVTREGARGRDPSARLRQLVSQRLPATMIPKRDKYDPKRGGE